MIPKLFEYQNANQKFSPGFNLLQGTEHITFFCSNAALVGLLFLTQQDYQNYLCI